MNETKHPTPWSIDKSQGDIIASNGEIVLYLSVQELDNDFVVAKRMVNAVNVHDDLLAALKETLRLGDLGYQECEADMSNREETSDRLSLKRSAIESQARAAIQKAEVA